MSELSWLGYTLVFAVSFGLSAGLVPLALRFAVRVGALDHPGGYKHQGDPVPYFGGVAIALAFSLAVLGATLLRPPVRGLAELAAIMGLALLLCAVGLIDDLRGLGPWVRLGVQAVAAVALVAGGFGVVLFGQPLADGLVTVLWVVGITNAFNLLDNMDGLSGGIAGIAALTLFTVAALNGQFLVAGLAVGLAGCAFAFLLHNRHPARIYMGDAGSLFLGFLIAVIAVKLRFAAPRTVTVFVPLVALTVPLLDTTVVTVSRLRAGRNVLSGGRDHLSHRLVALGLRVPGAVTVLYGAAAFCGWMALILSRVDSLTAWLIAACVAACAVVAGVLLGRVDIARSRRPLPTEVPAGPPSPPSAERLIPPAASRVMVDPGAASRDVEAGTRSPMPT